jgi:RIO kinase 1
VKVPPRLQPLIDEGIIDAVMRSLKSGKEAIVYVVHCGDQLRCAKIYKEADQRGFQKLAAYQEGRKRRGGRDERALKSGGRRGRELQETEWQSAEVDALYRLDAAGVRVPKPYGMFNGVLIMELICDAEGGVAPRLIDVDFTAETARLWFRKLIGDVVRMLCAGLIHGDLSEYNVLIDDTGPVIIDLPQVINASANHQAFRLLERDINNLRATLGRAAPDLLDTRYAHEIWALFQSSTLTPETPLSGQFQLDEQAADLDSIFDSIEDAKREQAARERGRIEAEQALDQE